MPLHPGGGVVPPPDKSEYSSELGEFEPMLVKRPVVAVDLMALVTVAAEAVVLFCR